MVALIDRAESFASETLIGAWQPPLLWQYAWTSPNAAYWHQLLGGESNDRIEESSNPGLTEEHRDRRPRPSRRCE